MITVFAQTHKISYVVVCTLIETYMYNMLLLSSIADLIRGLRHVVDVSNPLLNRTPIHFDRKHESFFMYLSKLQ